MAQVDSSKSVTWITGGRDDPELAADNAELAKHPELIKKYGQMLIDLSGLVSEEIRLNRVEALAFFTKAFAIIVKSSVKVLRKNREYENKSEF